ncbi:wHTH domain-containing protein [Streptomyces roseoverticillatus]|uniref:ATP-binding protein n=1 Tax=Streptomyces roseoverticillatus TaxID=66429 RepID=A0ABV3INI1_9ACTN
MRGKGNGGQGDAPRGGVQGNDFGGPAVFQQGERNEQHIQVNVFAGVVPLPPPDAPADASAHPEPWVALAEGSRAWDYVAEGCDAEPLRQEAVVVARRLAVARDEAADALAGDPWHDEGLAERIALRTDWLFTNVWAANGISISPVEAALLSLLPLLHHTRLARRAVAQLPMGPLNLSPKPSAGADRARYERFLHRSDRLVRRARTLGSDGGEIGWWLFHRWLAYDQDLAQEPWVPDLLSAAGPASGAFTAETLKRLLTAPDASPHELCGIDGLPHLQPPRWITPDRGQEQQLREQLVGVAFAVAQRLAIDITELSPTIVQHLGTAHPVSLAELRDTVAKAEWERRANGKERRLHARCHHNAVMAALRDHAARLDALLRAVHRAGGHGSWPQELCELPVYAGADAVVQVDRGGDELPPRDAVRFRFDENAVQELLVGEQLYRDSSLAVRELYQNALDACRYRRARVRAKAQDDGLAADAYRYDGEITFRQGEDERGRPFLSCTDNGVGMGEEELTGVFSEAGARFVDQPKYLAEKAKWAQLAEPVTLHPNSRFGIGVLSYFMLADEIEVTTRRMRESGEIGRRLRVRITGPGEFFQVDECKEQGGGPGTTVKLFLREDKQGSSAAETLRKLLGVAEFRTTVWEEGGESPIQAWEPRALLPRENRDEGLHACGTVVRWDGAGGQVFWCEEGGGLLVDGLLVELPRQASWQGQIQGAVVNLVGQEQVVLSVDRTRVLNDVESKIRGLLKAAVGKLTRDAPHLLSHSWIRGVYANSSWIGATVASAAIVAGLPIPLSKGGPVSGMCPLGFFPGDEDLLVPSRWIDPYSSGRRQSRVSDILPDPVFLWRILAHRPKEFISALRSLVPEIEAVGQVLPALPTDSELLGAGSLLWSVPIIGGLDPAWVLEVAEHAGSTPRSVVERAALLGIEGLESGRYPDTTTPDPVDKKLLSSQPWYAIGCPVTIVNLLHAQRETGLSLSEARNRLAAYGFTIAQEFEMTEELSRRDASILGLGIGVHPRWLGGYLGTPAHLAACAVDLDITVTEVCQRLTHFGIKCNRIGLPERPSEVDCDLLHLLNSATNNGSDARVSPGCLLWLVHKLGERAADVAARLSNLGFTVPNLPSGAWVDRRAVDLLSKGLDGHAPWLDARAEVPLSHLVAASWEAVQDPLVLEEQLDMWGFVVTQSSGQVDRERNDVILISRALDGDSPWLQWPRPVPLQHVFRAAHRLQWPLPRVADRLRYLGHTVPDLAETIRAALARVPMAGG